MNNLFKLIFDKMWATEVKPCQKDKVFLEWLKQAIKQDRIETINACIEIVSKYRRFDNSEELQELNELKKKV